MYSLLYNVCISGKPYVLQEVLVDFSIQGNTVNASDLMSHGSLIQLFNFITATEGNDNKFINKPSTDRNLQEQILQDNPAI